MGTPTFVVCPDAVLLALFKAVGFRLDPLIRLASTIRVGHEIRRDTASCVFPGGNRCHGNQVALERSGHGVSVFRAVGHSP
jgi:hypothetical protein